MPRWNARTAACAYLVPQGNRGLRAILGVELTCRDVLRVPMCHRYESHVDSPFFASGNLNYLARSADLRKRFSEWSSQDVDTDGDRSATHGGYW